jgi:hypothetical protein
VCVSVRLTWSALSSETVLTPLLRRACRSMLMLLLLDTRSHGITGMSNRHTQWNPSRVTYTNCSILPRISRLLFRREIRPWDNTIKALHCSRHFQMFLFNRCLNCSCLSSTSLNSTLLLFAYYWVIDTWRGTVKKSIFGPYSTVVFCKGNCMRCKLKCLIENAHRLVATLLDVSIGSMPDYPRTVFACTNLFP